jgi:hypothetical protein
MTIDDVLPTWDWRSAHATRVAASPERAAAAARDFSGRDLPVTGALMRVRALGRRTFDERPIVQAITRIGLAKLWAACSRRGACVAAIGRSPRPTSCARSPSLAGCASRRPSP